MAVTAMKEGVSELKRRLILEAAAKLFSERGYAATRIEDIITELSASRRVIYEHFGGKSDILVAICEQAIRSTIDLATRVARTPLDPVEKLRRLVREFTEIVIANRDYIAISTREMMFLPSDSRVRIARMQKKFDRILGTVLADGVERDVFALADPAITALAIGGMILWTHRWYRAGGRLSSDQVADAMAAAALNMVVRRGG
ncbi:MAG TPA: TetR family transcriptional regulator [Stellaceae bacterium]|nr:TetR family transcriptional regulator [Stellaceae bacterium]